MDARLETLYRMQPMSAAETDTLFTEVFAGSMSEPELRVPSHRPEDEGRDARRNPRSGRRDAARREALPEIRLRGGRDRRHGRRRRGHDQRLDDDGARRGGRRSQDRQARQPRRVVPVGRLVAQSGIRTHADVERVARARPASSSWAPSSIRPTTSRSP